MDADQIENLFGTIVRKNDERDKNQGNDKNQGCVKHQVYDQLRAAMKKKRVTEIKSNADISMSMMSSYERERGFPNTTFTDLNVRRYDIRQNEIITSPRRSQFTDNSFNDASE